jgi:hypothetical protein
VLPMGSSIAIDKNRLHPASEGPMCEDDPYPHYPPGIYEVCCFEAKIYRDPRFRSWKCRLGCHFLTEPDQVSGFLNMGVGEKPKAGRGSNYRRVWIMANGESPRKRQTLSRQVFVGKIFRVQIADVETRYDGREHLKLERYSTIREFLSRAGP